MVRLLPGASGVIDTEGFLKTLCALGYDGPLSVETFSAELNAMPPSQAAALASAALARVMKAAGVVPITLL
jgi:sugar phosphate isomerase/epimerase